MKRLHRDEGGAVALLCLAGILIIMLVTWVVFDAGRAARDKIEVQAAADTAAYSMSAVKSRSMNMIAYANVAKRSIVSIHATYMAGLLAYIGYWASFCGQCSWPYISKDCLNCYYHGAILISETFTDGEALTGILSNFVTNASNAIGALEGLLSGQCDLGFLIDGGNTADYHAKDLRALENYQLYTMGITPWWAFTEGAVRGMRNTATTLGSWPPPGFHTDINIPIAGFLNQVFAIVGNVVGAGSRVDRFPLRKNPDGYSSVADDIADSDVALIEKLANALIHYDESHEPSVPLIEDPRPIMFAATMLPAAISTFEISMRCLYDSWEPFGLPFEFQRFNNLGEWLMSTSYLVLAYNSSDEKFEAHRQKYGYVPGEFQHQLGGLDSFTYESSGYWAFAKSEMTYQGTEEPSPYIPGWSARLRPVAMPREWSDGGASMIDAYHDMLPWLAVTSALNGGATGNFMAPIRDLVYMERTARALGQSTVEGVSK